jgi:hypothetical protein
VGGEINSTWRMLETSTRAAKSRASRVAVDVVVSHQRVR